MFDDELNRNEENLNRNEEYPRFSIRIGCYWTESRQPDCALSTNVFWAVWKLSKTNSSNMNAPTAPVSGFPSDHWLFEWKSIVGYFLKTNCDSTGPFTIPLVKCCLDPTQTFCFLVSTNLQLTSLFISNRRSISLRRDRNETFEPKHKVFSMNFAAQPQRFEISYRSYKKRSTPHLPAWVQIYRF